eukprot:1053443-Pyramimonas_sp.AAC.1
MLGDNLGLILSLSKGRCRDPRLLMLHRKAAAWALATKSRFVCRWLPSELNPADGPSRKREPSAPASRPAGGAPQPPADRADE